MFKKVIVPLDGSQLAERAVVPALKLMEAEKGEVIFLHVLNRDPVYVEVATDEPLGFDNFGDVPVREKMKEYLDSIVVLHPVTNATVRSIVVEGDEASHIVDTAVHEAADLIMMTTNGRSGFSRWILGSVTERVLQAAPCPVLALRDAIDFNHILITLDGSKLAEKALAPGFEIARQFESKVTLLQAFEPVFDVAEAAVAKAQVLSGKYESKLAYMQDQKQKYLIERLSEHQADGTVVGNVVLAEGPAADEILKFAETNHIDIIVMSTHGYTGIRRWAYGSVTQKVLRQAQCALLIVP